MFKPELDGCFTRLKVAVEHGFSAHVVFVGDLLSRAVVVLQGGAVNGSNQRFAQVQLINLRHKNVNQLFSLAGNNTKVSKDGIKNLKVDLEELVAQKHHPPLLGVLDACSTLKREITVSLFIFYFWF